MNRKQYFLLVFIIHFSSSVCYKQYTKTSDHQSDNNRTNVHAPKIITQIEDETKYVRFNNTCTIIIDGNIEIGQSTFLKNCPFALEEINNGNAYPRLCKYDICDDFVCCPRIIRHKIRKICRHEDIGQILFTRLLLNFNCKIYGTDIEGVYSKKMKCPYFVDDIAHNHTIPRVCNYNSCEDYVCCPTSDLTNVDCRNYLDYNYDSVGTIGDSCIIQDSHESGTCRANKHCPSIRNFKSVTMCGSDCGTSIICCPNPVTVTKSEKACYSFQNAVYDDIKKIKLLPSEIDDKRTGVAVSPSGGQSASPKEFPHMAALGYETEDLTIEYHCGGTLISEYYILTAGHCLVSAELGEVKKVRLGILNLQIVDGYTDCPEDFDISERIPHPLYTRTSQYNDIALLRLDRIVEFTPYLLPACLTNSVAIPEKNLIAIGFGATGASEKSTDILLKVNLDLFPHQECNESFQYNINRKFRFGILDETQFCAGSRKTIQDTCVGDSGGPIEISNSEYFHMSTVVGITSFGRACGFPGSPAVYTRLSYYIDWVESIVWST